MELILPITRQPRLTEPNLPKTRQAHLTFKANLSLGRHGWLRLTPAYGVQLVERLVAELGDRDEVLDPFCGTGTTALVCAQNGIACDTVDVNPFLVWLTKTKCDTYTEADCKQVARLPVPSADATHWTPPIHDIEKWWDPPILQKLASIFRRIQSSQVSEKTRNLLKASFCRIVIKTGNVNFGHQSMSFKRAGLNGHLAKQIDSEFNFLIEETIANALDNPKVSPGIYRGDSRSLDKFLPHNRYTAVITSPPYPNRMSYIRELRPYMYWLGFLENAKQASELDWQAIGGTWGTATSNLTKWAADITVPHEGFYETIHSIRQGASPILATYVHKYFIDAVHHIRGLNQCVKRGGKLYYVVGNSKFYDTMLHTEEIYASILRAEGFEVTEIENIRKRSSKKELFEFIVKAKKR
jgi:hypothetical protein